MPEQQPPALLADDAPHRFLQLCMRARWDTRALEAAESLAKDDAIDWDALCQMARAEALSPLLYRTVRGRHLVPPAVEQNLRDEYYQTASRNTLLLHELERVLDHLTGKGIPVILLKGAALAIAIYGDIALRPMLDLDLLVHEEHVPATLQVLATLGYTCAHVETHAGAAMAYENEVLLTKPGIIDTPVEIHWSLFDSPYYQHALPMDWFWQTTRSVQVNTTPALMLSPETQILHLCGHLVLHHSSTGILWLHDIAEVIQHYREELDWAGLLARAQECNLILPLQQVLPRLTMDWGAPIPGEVLNRLHALQASPGEVRVFTRLTSERRSVAWRFWFDLMSLPGWRQRLHFAWSNLFPSPAYMQHRYRISHPVLLPLYYPYRWLLGLRSVL